jgi:predicted MarR family transcription regulator
MQMHSSVYTAVLARCMAAANISTANIIPNAAVAKIKHIRNPERKKTLMLDTLQKRYV